MKKEKQSEKDVSTGWEYIETYVIRDLHAIARDINSCDDTAAKLKYLEDDMELEWNLLLGKQTNDIMAPTLSKFSNYQFLAYGRLYTLIKELNKEVCPFITSDEHAESELRFIDYNYRLWNKIDRTNLATKLINIANLAERALSFQQSKEDPSHSVVFKYEDYIDGRYPLSKKLVDKILYDTIFNFQWLKWVCETNPSPVPNRLTHEVHAEAYALVEALIKLNLRKSTSLSRFDINTLANLQIFLETLERYWYELSHMDVDKLQSVINYMYNMINYIVNDEISKKF